MKTKSLFQYMFNFSYKYILLLILIVVSYDPDKIPTAKFNKYILKQVKYCLLESRLKCVHIYYTFNKSSGPCNRTIYGKECRTNSE